MKHDDARAVLVGAVEEHAEALGNFVLRGDSMTEARIAKFDLTRGLAAQVQEEIWAQIAKLGDKQFIPYDPSYQTSSAQVLVEDLSLIPDLASVDAKIRRGDVPSDSGGPVVVAMAHAVGLESSQVVAYRVKGPGIATRRAKGLLQLVPRDGVYEPIDEELLIYEPRFDVFTCSGWAYFTTTTLIQTKLNAPEKARRLAKDALATATKKIDIEGIAELQKAVMDDPTLRAKMAHIARLIDTDPEYVKNLTTEKLVKFIDANPDYDILLASQDGKRILRFDPSPKHRHQIPKLLADDFLVSQLTNRKYEAGSKHRMVK